MLDMTPFSLDVVVLKRTNKATSFRLFACPLSLPYSLLFLSY